MSLALEEKNAGRLKNMTKIALLIINRNQGKLFDFLSNFGRGIGLTSSKKVSVIFLSLVSLLRKRKENNDWFPFLLPIFLSRVLSLTPTTSVVVNSVGFDARVCGVFLKL